MRRLALSLSLALWSCSPPMPGEDAGVTPDASVIIDAGPGDAGVDANERETIGHYLNGKPISLD